jgi:hypothetical protein
MTKQLLVTTAKRLSVPHPFSRMVSRISYKPDFFRHKLDCEFVPDLLKIQRKAPDWKTCCLERAQSLLQRYPGKIWLSWSGGIDSTTLVASILEVASPEDRKRLTIVLSHHSVLENPSYYENYICDLPYKNILEDLSKQLMKENAVLITGELGDQLFGSDFLIDQDFGEDYKTSATRIIGKGMFERLHPIVGEAPFPIRSAHDFFWWFNFTQKWQFVKYRCYEHTTWNLQAKYGQHIEHFFDSIDFQLWSLQNHDLKHNGSWATYKTAAKDFLFQVTKDPAQTQLKKWQSLEKTYLVSENRLAIDKNLNPVNTFEELEQYVAH